jgi:hypothetical protein
MWRGSVIPKSQFCTLCRQVATGRFLRLETNPRARCYIEEALNGKTKTGGITLKQALIRIAATTTLALGFAAAAPVTPAQDRSLKERPQVGQPEPVAVVRAQDDLKRDVVIRIRFDDGKYEMRFLQRLPSGLINYSVGARRFKLTTSNGLTKDKVQWFDADTYRVGSPWPAGECRAIDPQERCNWSHTFVYGYSPVLRLKPEEFARLIDAPDARIDIGEYWIILSRDQLQETGRATK